MFLSHISTALGTSGLGFQGSLNPLNARYATVSQQRTKQRGDGEQPAVIIHTLKPGFHSNARNARKALFKEKYASKLKKCARNATYARKLRKQKTKVRKRKSRN